MKINGTVRIADGMGRIVLPKEQRKMLDIKPNERMEIFALEDGFFLRKYDPERSGFEIESTGKQKE